MRHSEVPLVERMRVARINREWREDDATRKSPWISLCRGIPALVASCSRLIALTEPNQSKIEKLHARAGSRIRIAEPRLRSPAQLDKSSKTRAPFEAQRSTGLILCLHSDNDSTHPIIFVALDPAARCSGQRKGCPRILFHLEQKVAGGRAARIAGIAFEPTAMRQNGGRPPKLNPNRSAPRSLIT